MGETVARNVAGDRFTALVVPQIDLLLRVAHTMVARPADAEDLVQETLARAFRSIDTFDGVHPRAWLLTIMRNIHVNMGRKRRPTLLDDPDTVAEIPSPAADTSVEERYDEAVDSALASLSARHRAVIDLVDIGGLSYAEAAIALGVSVGTIMSRLRRARSKVRGTLRSAGFCREGMGR